MRCSAVPIRWTSAMMRRRVRRATVTEIRRGDKGQVRARERWRGHMARIHVARGRSEYSLIQWIDDDLAGLVQDMPVPREYDGGGRFQRMEVGLVATDFDETRGSADLLGLHL